MAPAEHPGLQCVCSPQGFAREAWSKHYYPDSCPEDWRIAYFMNDFPAVYLLADDWLADDGQEQVQFFEVLQAELEPGFDLILQWPSGLSGHDNTALLRRLTPLSDNIACLVLDVSGYSEQLLQQSIYQLSAYYPLNLDCPATPSAKIRSIAEIARAGFVWHGEAQGVPLMVGEYQVLSLACLPLRDYTPLLRQFQSLMSEGQRAGLFIAPAAQTAQRALELRTVIELLDLA